MKTVLIHLLAILICLSLICFAIYESIYKYPDVREDESQSPRQGVIAKEISYQPSPTRVPEYREATVSWYDQSACGEKIYRENCQTANGELFDEQDLTFASLGLAFNTNVQFCYGGRCVTCRSNDRGPYIPGREYDLSLGCATQLGIKQAGVVTLKYKILE